MHSHNSKPMMQFSSQLINPGVETLINLKPTITYTTKEAIDKFSPEQRQCYVEGEIQLNYLNRKFGYKYDMNNCLIDTAIQDIIWNCRCRPKFVLYKEITQYLKLIPFCTGKKLFCANARSKSFGMEKIAMENNIIVPEAMTSPNKIGNISKPPAIKCLQSCLVQENNNLMSTAPYPQKENFFYLESFCDVATHIWRATCNYETFCNGCNRHRNFFLKRKFPNLCPVLENFKEYLNSTKTCKHWTESFPDEPNSTLVNEMYEYGKNNLAFIRIVIQSPYVTKIQRDVAVSFTSFVANTGGLLGLCLGFSFISGVELVFWCCCCCCKGFNHKATIMA